MIAGLAGCELASPDAFIRLASLGSTAGQCKGKCPLDKQPHSWRACTLLAHRVHFPSSALLIVHTIADLHFSLTGVCLVSTRCSRAGSGRG